MRRSTISNRLLTHVALVLIIFLAAILRLRGLGDPSLWLDESIVLERASGPLSQLPSALREYDVHPPLLHVLFHFLLPLGQSEWFLRLPLALFGVSIVPILYTLSKRILGSASGLAAALLLAVSPFQIHLSREVRPYPLLGLLSLLSLYGLLRAMEENQRAWWTVFTVTSVLNVYLHYFAWFATAGTLLFAAVTLGYRWLRQRSQEVRRTTWHLILSCGVIGIAYVPWWPIMRVNFVQASASRLGVPQISRLDLLASFFARLLRQFGGGVRIPATITALAVILGLVMMVWRRQWRALLLFACWTVVPSAAIAVQGPTSLLGRYPRFVSYLQPLYLLIAGTGIVGLAASVANLAQSPTFRRRLHASVLILTLILLVLGFVNVSAIGQYEAWEKPDWKGVVAYLQSIASKGDIVIVDGDRYMNGGDSGRVSRMMRWYLPQNDAKITLWHEVEVARSVQGIAHEVRQVHAVLYVGAAARWLSDPQNEVSVSRFEDLVVLSLHEPKPSARDNAVEMLLAMTRLLQQREARFDIYLGLAELAKSVGDLQRTETYIELALASKPVTFSPDGWRGTAYRRLGLDQ